MTTGKAPDIRLNVSANTGPALNALDQVRDRAIQTKRRLDAATGGGVTRGGRIGGALGRGAGVGVGIVGAGAGLSAGLAVLEQLVEKLIELFEGTQIFEQFTEALQSLLQALAPVIGVLIAGLTPALEALQPLLTQLAVSLSPVIEELTAGLVSLISALVPVLIPAIQVLGVALTITATIVRKLADAIAWVINQISRFIPNLNLGSTGGAYAIAAGQLEQARLAREAEEMDTPRTLENKVETRVIVDGRVIEDTARRRRKLDTDYGRSIR